LGRWHRREAYFELESYLGLFVRSDITCPSYETTMLASIECFRDLISKVVFVNKPCM
jgi:hypothetical protein